MSSSVSAPTRSERVIALVADARARIPTLQHARLFRVEVAPASSARVHAA